MNPKLAIPASLRQIRYGSQLEIAYAQIRDCYHHVWRSEAQGRARILSVINAARQEIQWGLHKWQETGAYFQWLTSRI